MTNHAQRDRARERWVWAIDPAVTRVAFGLADMDGDELLAMSITIKTDTREGERLSLLAGELRVFAHATREQFPPHVVFVEQPSGHIRNLQLAYATGVIQAALHEALEVPVWTVPSGKWKKAALGYGNASKEQVAAWCKKLRLGPATQDEADALAMAHAGRLMMLTGRWDAREAA